MYTSLKVYLCCLFKKAAHNEVKNITKDNFYFYPPAFSRNISLIFNHTSMTVHTVFQKYCNWLRFRINSPLQKGSTNCTKWENRVINGGFMYSGIVHQIYCHLYNTNYRLKHKILRIIMQWYTAFLTMSTCFFYLQNTNCYLLPVSKSQRFKLNQNPKKILVLYCCSWFFAERFRHLLQYICLVKQRIEQDTHPKKQFGKVPVVEFLIEECKPRNCIRGRSQTTFTRFVFFWPPSPLRLHFLWYKSLQKVDFFDHLPPSSCKRSLWMPPNAI